MRKDPFFQEIAKRLGWDLDPDLFEACVNDLLRESYPTLAPIPGGRDAGMDGAISDSKGEAIPLVVTSQEDVIGNLTKSLKSYLAEGKNRTEVVLATSQSISPRRRRNLEERAREMGFVLVNVHEREDIANRLYRRPDWCMELLQLTGRPSAFSEIPKSARPILNSELIGRNSVLDWLRMTSGDRLLVGQPGSGKTYLLLQYVLEGHGFFVVDEDRGNIAESIRSFQPKTLIVDDAGNQLPLLMDLIHLRKELGAEFNILASCWYLDEEEVQTSLNLNGDSIHHMDLLTRDEIVKVIDNVGIVGPDELISEIVNQAEGRPGLAAMLSHLCLIGNVQQVFKGEILTASILRYLESNTSEQSTYILAALALGGNDGMSLETVADGLRLPLIEIHNLVTKLAIGGILWEIRGHYISLHPSALRHILIRDIFFQGAFSIPITPLIDQVPNPTETAIELIGAYWAGARVDFKWLTEFLEQANSRIVWEHFAWQGPEEAKWVMDHHPDLAAWLALPLLSFIPEVAIPRLFEASIGDNRPLHSTVDHPMRIIEDWIKSGWTGDEKTIMNRLVLLQSAKDWLTSGKDPLVGTQAIKIGLSPICESIRTDPGSGNTVTISSALLSTNEINQLVNAWTEVKTVLISTQNFNWKKLQEIVSDWAYPSRIADRIPKNIWGLIQEFAGRLLVDLGEIANGKPGISRWINQVAIDVGFDIHLPIDQYFDTLYPVFRRADFREHELEHSKKVKQLAADWSHEYPSVIIDKLKWIENEAKDSGHTWPRWSIILCNEIASIVDSCIEWINQLVITLPVPEFVFPFLKQAVEKKEDGWETVLNACLDIPSIRGAAIHVVILLQEIPQPFVNRTLDLVPGYSSLIETACTGGEIRNNNLLTNLLVHPDLSISTATARGLWFGKERVDLQQYLAEWEKAVMQCEDDFLISEVIKVNSEIAIQWLIQYVSNRRNEFNKYKQTIRVAVKNISYEERKRVLDQVPDSIYFNEFVFTLIDNDVALYADLLQNRDLKRFHLVPLLWSSDTKWIEKAKLALTLGYSAQQIAIAAYGFPLHVTSFSGHESAHHKNWIDRFETLIKNPDEDVQKIGIEGKKIAIKDYERALKKEKHEAIFGFRE